MAVELGAEALRDAFMVSFLGELREMLPPVQSLMLPQESIVRNG